MASSAVKLQVRGDGVAIIAIHNPPKNTLNNNVMTGLQMRFKEAHAISDVKAIVLTGSHDNFSFGVDLNLFQHIQKQGCDSNTQFVPAIPFMTMIEDGPKPVVAALQGCVIGAGLEMTLACHSRIASLNALFSIPDFHNGIIPGLGGTQRLPRLVGLRKALQIFWMTRPFTAMEAMEAGLIDEVVVNGDVLEKACSLALGIFHKKFPWNKSLERVDRLEIFEEALQILRRARLQAKRDHPNLIHPLICIDVMEEGVLKGGLAGAILEEKFSHALVNTPIAKGLMHIFFARRSVSKIPGNADKLLKPQKIGHVAVIGCGSTGTAIATAFLLSKIPTLVKANNNNELQTGLSLIEENLRSLEAKRTISQRQMKSMAALLSGTTDYMHFSDIQLIVETVEESTADRYKVLEELARISNPNCILVTNSPLINLSAVSNNQHTHHDRIFGMHFISPAYNNELVEISFLESTSPQAVVDVFAFVKSMKKLPLAVKCSTGLIVDRLRFVYSMSASILGELGAADKGCIHALLKDFGMSMDSFGSAEFQGQVSPLETLTYMSHSQNISGSITKDQKQVSFSEDDILDMLLFPVVNEAYQILRGGIVETAEHIDIASVLGMGFPSYRGGILFWARSVGLDFILSQLSKWSNQYGSFFKPFPWHGETVHQVKSQQASNPLLARL